ncbi:MAG: LysR family transcriptional regulator [Nitrospinae bacterium]|nr:LysR family transcriptional regulator [Nitrospinota bacterium]
MPRARTFSEPRLRGRIWIEGPEGTFLGYGRVVLLERIREHHSISAAARSMSMSYRHAWDLVASMNRQSAAPVVEMSAGGRGGGGARLTAGGERAITMFWSAYKDFQRFLETRGKKLAPRRPSRGKS